MNSIYTLAFHTENKENVIFTMNISSKYVFC